MTHKKKSHYLLAAAMLAVSVAGYAQGKDTVFVVLSKREVLKGDDLAGISKDKRIEFWSKQIPDQPIRLHHITGWHKVIIRPKNLLRETSIGSKGFYGKTLDELIKYFRSHVVFVINKKDWHFKEVLCHEVVLNYQPEE